MARPKSYAVPELRGESRAARGIPAALSELPAVPDELRNERARREWERAGRALVEVGVLTAANLAAFTLYCGVAGELLTAWAEGRAPPSGLYAQFRRLMNDLRIAPVHQGFPVDLAPGPEAPADARVEAARTGGGRWKLPADGADRGAGRYPKQPPGAGGRGSVAAFASFGRRAAQ